MLGMFLIAYVLYRDNAPPLDDEDTVDVDESLTEELVMASENAVREFPDVNSAPEFPASVTRDVNENEEGNVGDKVVADDADMDVLAYDITGGADMGAFEITNDQQEFRPDHRKGRDRSGLRGRPEHLRSRSYSRRPVRRQRFRDGDHQGHERERGA